MSLWVTRSVVLFLALACAINAQSDNPPQTKGLGKEAGPWVWPTRGEVWPKPQSIVNYNEGFMVVRTNMFSFRVVQETCDIIEQALNRYYTILVTERDNGLRAYGNIKNNNIPPSEPWLTKGEFKGYLDALEVELVAPCEYMPYYGMDEHYELRVDSPDLPGEAKLVSQSVWGILRGLETFVQMVAPNVDGGTVLQINSSMVADYPRFSYRGFMLDSVRHFHPVPLIKKLVDGMEATKLNVLHWHITDDQAFPYQSKVFPELSEKGAYHPFTHVHSHSDIQEILEYCRMRGIRVIPEFDSPGHTRSWGNSHPEILATCYGEDGEPDGSYGPLDPSKTETYDFVRTLFEEVADLFPDDYMHLGGDEVDFKCWESNADINAFMEAQGIAGDYAQLEELYIAEAIKITEGLNKTAILWQEVFDNGLQLSPKAVVHVWKPGHEAELSAVTAAGHIAILSSCWYLDHLATGGDWKKYYECEPHNFSGSEAQKQLVLGGEACMWSEYVDSNNVVSRVFPRASAMAERLWSDESLTDTVEAARRLEEFRCRMVRRGIGAQPANGPGFCPGETF